MDGSVNVVCAMANPDDDHFILNQAKKLGCGRFVCTKCFSRAGAYICCNQCYKDSKAVNVESTIYNQIRDNFNKIYDEMTKQFETVHSILIERKDEFKGTINYLTDEIDIRVESLKQEINDQADKLKSKLNDLLIQMDPDNLKYTYKHELMKIDGDDCCESKRIKKNEDINEEMLTKIQESISSMRRALKDYCTQTAVHISEKKLGEDLLIEQDLDIYNILLLYKNQKLKSRDIVPDSRQMRIMEFCMLPNGNACIIDLKNTLYVADKDGKIKEVEIENIIGVKELVGEDIKSCDVNSVFGSFDGSIYISLLFFYKKVGWILKLTDEFTLISAKFIEKLNTQKMHVDDNHLYVASSTYNTYCESTAEIYKLSRDGLEEIYKHDIVSCATKNLSFLNNSLAVYYHHHVYVYELEPFNIKYRFEIIERIDCLTVINNRFCAYDAYNNHIRLWSFDGTQKFVDFREYNDNLDCGARKIRQYISDCYLFSSFEIREYKDDSYVFRFKDVYNTNIAGDILLLKIKV